MDNLKASEAYQYLHSNKVGCVMSYKHDRFVYLKANVEPSQCLNSAWHNAWVLVTEAGEVKTAGCTCVRWTREILFPRSCDPVEGN